MRDQLYIRLNGDHLELSSGSVLQIVEQNPYLQFNQDLQGDYSYPIDIPLSEVNLRLLEHTQLLPVQNKNVTVKNVTVGDSTEQLYGVLRKEQIKGNLNYIGTDVLSAYFLKGWSSFLKDVQNDTLQAVEYGGERRFANDDVMFAHFTDTALNGSIDTEDYTFFPLYNTDAPFPATLGNYGHMYNIFYPYISGDRSDLYFKSNRYAGCVPALFPYINFMLKKIFEHYGWQIDGFIFSDPDFKKLVLLNTHIIQPFARENGDFIFDVKDSMPLVKISDFIISLKNRFGWWLDWDYSKKCCTIKQIQKVFVANRGIDITDKVDADFNLKIAEQNKIYGLGNNGINQNAWDYKGVKKTVDELPAPNQFLDGNIYFVAYENYFYQCGIKNGSTTEYEWQLFQENNFGYQPNGTTDTIATSCNITGTKIIDLLDQLGGVRGKYLVPTASMQTDNTDTDSFTVAFHLQPQMTKRTGSTVSCQYPYGGAGPYGWQGGKMTNFSLSYQFIDPFTGEDLGLYNKFWKTFLDKLNATETLEITAALTRQQVYSFNWETSYLINNTQYIVQQRQRTIPYNDDILLTLIRVSG